MTSFLYQYLVGGFVFAVGLFAGWRSGQLGWRPGRPRRRLLILLGGFVFFATIQGILLIWSRSG